MSVLFQYLLKLSISLGVVYLFYYFLLRKLTFYNANRWYLLLYSFSSFLIPIINIYPVLQKNQLEVSGIVNYIPAVSSRITMSDPGLSKAIPYEDARMAAQWVIIIIVLGILVMLIRLLIQYISFLRVKRSSTLVVASPIRIFQVNDSIIPFSIGNSIFINQQLHNEEELREIIRHEFIHVKQKHSIDIFLSELLCVLNWYNPFAWMIRRAIKVNLEFIADNKVLEGGFNKKQYQYLLLKVIGVPQFRIAAQFNFSSLKKRIAMMNKKQSAKSHLLKLLLLLPVLVIVLLAFRSAGKNFQFNFRGDGIYQDTIPPKPSKPAAPAMDVDDFLKRNPSVKNFGIRNNILTINLKSGGKETYNLSKESEVTAAEKKYGQLPAEPPPPPPPPPPPRAALPKEVKSISITETKAVVILSNGKKEEYDLTKTEELETFQNKYRMIESPEELEKMHRELEMELIARHDEMMNLKRSQEREYELLRNAKEAELMHMRQEKEDEMRRISMDRQKELELLQKKFQMEAEQDDYQRKKELEKASKDKGADVEKLMKQYEIERDRDMAQRQMQLLKVTREKEAEMEMLSKKFELEARSQMQMQKEQLEYKQREMRDHMNDLHEQNARLQNKINLDSRNLSADEKKEVISQLEVQKKELNKLMQDLKVKETEINKQIQDLKKAQGRN